MVFAEESMSIKIRAVFTASYICLLLVSGSSVACASQTKEGLITSVVKDVTLVSAQGDARNAALNDGVPNLATVRTGADSRAEITFANREIARLWANTVLGVKKGSRDLELNSGVVLFQAPAGVKAKIHGIGVAAAISGGTVMFEYHEKVFKFLVLEGTGRLYRPGHLGDSLLVHPGQMVIGNAKSPLSDPVDFDIGRFVKTSRLILDFAPLRSQRLMVAESSKQQREKSKKVLIDTNLVIFGGGTLVSIIDPTVDPTSAARPNAALASPQAKTK
jgi:FecR protein